MGSKFLKLIPLQIKEEAQPKMFEKKLKKNLKDRTLYSLDLFFTDSPGTSA